MNKIGEMASRATNKEQKNRYKKMKQFIQDILQDILRKSILLLALLLVGAGEVGAWTGVDPAWSPWTGTTLTNDTYYYIFTKNQNRFLKDNNQGLGWYGDVAIPRWKVENLSGNIFNLTSTNSFQFVLSAKSEDMWYGTSYWIEPSTNMTTIARESNDAKLKSDINGDFRTIYRSEKYHDKARNVKSIPSGIGVEMQKDASAEWLFVPQSEYNNATAHYYLYNVGTGQFLTFQSDGSQIMTYTTNDPSQASLVTILTKYISGEDKKSFIQANIEGTKYYMYHSQGNNAQYTSNDKFFTISPKTIGTNYGYQLILKNGDDHNRYARAGYGDFLENRSFSALDFPKDDGESLNTLWLFISEAEYNAATKTKLAPVHVPFDYDRYMLFDGEVTTRRGDSKWDYSANRVWLNEEQGFFDIHFEGIPENLSFEYRPKTSKGVPGILPYEDRVFFVMQSPDGITWSEPIFSETNNSSDNKVPSGNILLEPTTRYVRFSIEGCTAAASVKENIGGLFYDIKVTELHQFTTEESVYDFGKVNREETATIRVPFIHANAGNVVTVSSPPASLFTAATPVPNTGKDKLGIEFIEVTFTPAGAIAAQLDLKLTATITFSDEKGNTHYITVKGTPTALKVPKFTWNGANEPYYCSSSEEGAETYQIANILSSTNTDPTATITFESSNSSIAEVIENTLYIYTKDNEEREEVTITVSQIAISGWTEKTESFTFTPRKKIDLHVPFMVTKDIFENAEVYSKKVNESISYSSGNSQGYRWDDDAEIKLGGDNSSIFAWWVDAPVSMYGEKYVIFEFDGIPDSLFFRYRTNQNQATADANVAHKPYWTVLTSEDGDAFTQVEQFQSGSEPRDYANRSIALPHTARFLKLVYQGNFAGYFTDVHVTAFDGYYFVKEADSDKYLSRGGIDRTKAVVDDYGIAVRKTRSIKEKDNEHPYTHLQHVDNRQYLCEDNEGNLITNTIGNLIASRNGESTDLGNVYFCEEKEDGNKYIFYSNYGTPNYVQTLVDNSLGRTVTKGNATRWILQTQEEHAKAMQKLKDQQAETATMEFGEVVYSYGRMRERLQANDYDRDTVYPSPISKVAKASEQYEVKDSVYDAASNNYVVTNDNKRILHEQTFSGLTPGLYCLNVKAFYRVGENENAYSLYQSGFDCPVAYVTMKDIVYDRTATTQIGSVYDSYDIQNNMGSGELPDYTAQKTIEGEEKTIYYPNGLTAAAKLFNKDLAYDNQVYLYVEGTEVTFSIVAPSNSGYYNWLCFKDITLTRLYRKEFVFDAQVDAYWTNGDNWYYSSTTDRGTVPTIVNKAIITQPVTISEASVGAYQITYEGQGKITVASDGCLSVREGGFKNNPSADIVLKADYSGKTGALRLYPGITPPDAHVELNCRAYWDRPNGNAVWQYIGSPISNPAVNQDIFYQCWLYQWNDDGSWTNAGNWGHMTPFLGYAFTRDARSTTPPYVFDGKINNPEDIVLHLRNFTTKENAFANSWTSPIDITKFEEEDFNNVSKTLYLFEMGSETFNEDAVADKGNYSGQYLAIPIFTAREASLPTSIPAMQGFVVRPEEGKAEASLKLDYTRLIWKNEEGGTNNALCAPQRHGSDLSGKVCVHLISADSIADRVYLLEKEARGFTKGYDDGYDAEKMFADGLPAIYTYEPFGKLAVSATDTILGTYLGINTSASSLYSIRFSNVIGEGMGLRDLVADTVFAISEDTHYTFMATPNTANQLRFVVEEYVPTYGNGGTSLEDVNTGELRMWQASDLLSVTNAGRNSCLYLYDSAGKLIVRQPFNDAMTYTISSLPVGVYLAKVNTTTLKVLR